MSHKKIIILNILMLCHFCLYAQTKNQQIISLNNSIDSLKQVIQTITSDILIKQEKFQIVQVELLGQLEIKNRIIENLNYELDSIRNAYSEELNENRYKLDSNSIALRTSLIKNMIVGAEYEMVYYSSRCGVCDTGSSFYYLSNIRGKFYSQDSPCGISSKVQLEVDAKPYQLEFMKSIVNDSIPFLLKVGDSEISNGYIDVNKAIWMNDPYSEDVAFEAGLIIEADKLTIPLIIVDMEVDCGSDKFMIYLTLGHEFYDFNGSTYEIQNPITIWNGHKQIILSKSNYYNSNE